MAARQEEQPVSINTGELPAPLVFPLLLAKSLLSNNIINTGAE
jgi:hypothetical protein